jgi:hypothetical protein
MLMTLVYELVKRLSYIEDKQETSLSSLEINGVDK